MSDAPEQRLDDETFSALVTMLEERCGLYFHSGNRDILDAGLSRVAEAERTSVERLGQKLLNPPEALLQRLIQAITICETYFFRHPEQFAVIGEHAVPQLLQKGRTRLRALCAGCATGEEAYSLAITLRAHAPGCEVHVLGTDINQAALKIAERGRYGQYSIRVPSLLYDALLTSLPGGEFEVTPLVQKLVSFRPLNLRDSNFPALLGYGESFDIIFCRNVLIYFAPSQAVQVLSRLCECLCEGGYLCVSALDLGAQIPGLEQVLLGGVPIFRRASAASRMSTSAPPPSRRSPLYVPQSRPSLSTAPLSRGAAVPPAPQKQPAEKASLIAALNAAKSAADRGMLDHADAIARDALTQRRSPEALHLLALILGERGQAAEMETLLLEAIEHSPGYVLGHLSLGLIERPPSDRWRSEYYLNTVLELLRSRRDEEVLQGPECLQVAMARRLAKAGLENLEKRL